MKLLSFVVPVYNVEMYIRQCLESLILDVDYSYEIVVVNDGSTDNSEKIVMEFKTEYPDIIKYVKQENRGLSAARNCGIDLSEGKYISFIDSDDFIIKDKFLELLNTIVDKNLDFVIGNYFKLYDNRREIHRFNRFKRRALHEESLSGKSYLKLMYDYLSDEFDAEAVTQIYSTNFLKENNIHFIEGIIHEDTMFMFTVLSKANNICVRDISFYAYRMREGSIMHSLGEKHYKSLVIIIKNILQIVDNEKWKYCSVNSYLISLLYEVYKYDLEVIVCDKELRKILSLGNLTFKALIKKIILVIKIRSYYK